MDDDLRPSWSMQSSGRLELASPAAEGCVTVVGERSELAVVQECSKEALASSDKFYM